MLKQAYARLPQKQTALLSYGRCFFSSSRANFMIETGEVAELIASGDKNLRFVNASWYMPGSKVDAKEQHEESRLTPSTQYMSISEVVMPGSKLPNTLPSAEVFSECMRPLRIGKNHQIVCYDHVGMFSVARAAWMLRFFGAANVRIMNGGLQKWIKEGRPVASGPYTPGEGLLDDGDYNYEAKDPSRVVTNVERMHELAGQLYRGSKDWQITDARPSVRFNGEVEEPRGVRAGNIAGSVNLPYSTFVDAETGCLKSDDELRKVFETKGVDLSKNTVHSCGSGVTACIVDLAWNISGGKPAAVYDGSWSEYGRHEEPDFNKKV